MAKPRPEPPLERERAGAIEPLNLLSKGDLACRLGMPIEKLESIAAEAHTFYNPKSLPKLPRPFAKKESKLKVREIDRPSITAGRVYFVWRRVLKCSRKVARLLTTLTTFNGYLPQGAPTSTTLSNMVLYSVDLAIRKAAEAQGVVYSSWVDDLPLSGACARELIPVAITTLKRAGFKISRPKLKVMGPRKQRIVNGVVAGEIPSISKQDRDRIRAALHRLRIGDIREEDQDGYIATQKGRIAYLAGVNPRQAKRFQLELAQLLEKFAR